MHAAAAVGLYALVTALLFRNLLPNLTTHLYSDLGDPLLNTSILAWNALYAPLSEAWWNFPSFAPLPGVTAFTEHLLLSYPVATPVIWLTGNPVLAHNIVLMAAFPLNGWAAFLLARELTASSLAAFIGGLAFAFAPYHSVHLSHIQTLVAFGMPLALLGLHRYQGLVVSGCSRTVGPLALFGIGWLITALSNAYMLMFFPVLVALWCVWCIRPREWRRVIPIGATAVLFSLPLIPLLLGYRLRQAAYGFSREYNEIRTFGADVIGLVGISHREAWWRGVLPHTFEESALFPGLTIVVLGIIALAARRHGPQPPDRSASMSTAHPKRVAMRRLFSWPATVVAPWHGRAWSTRLLSLAALLTLIVLARIWTGPFGWHIGPLPLPPFAPYVLFSIAMPAGVLGLALTTYVRGSWSRRDPVVFYAVAVMALWLLALGPEPEWSSSRLRALVYAPYALLTLLPGFDSIRVPARAWLPAVLCLAVLAAAGVAAVSRLRRPVVALLALAIVAEGWFVERTVRVPTPMPAGIIPPGAMVLDLPMDEGFWNAVPQYRAVLGGYRTLNGFSGYEPRHFNPLRHEIADQYVDALNPYRLLGDLYVVLRPGEAPKVVRWVLDHAGAEDVHRSAAMHVVRLPAMTPPPRPRVPVPLPRAGTRPFGVR
jgi:hypothetical protein